MFEKVKQAIELRAAKGVCRKNAKKGCGSTIDCFPRFLFGIRSSLFALMMIDVVTIGVVDTLLGDDDRDQKQQAIRKARVQTPLTSSCCCC